MKDDLVSRNYLLTEYDRQHEGPPGGARKIIEEAPSVVPDINDGDMISRRAAIDALAKSMPSLTTPDGSGTFDHDIYVAQETIADDIRIIKDLPSVQPTYQWHEFRQEQNPETGLWEWAEPLPKDGQRILVTVCVEGHEPVQEDFWYEDGSGCWLDSGYDIGTEAIAWMPLPKEYSGE